MITVIIGPMFSEKSGELIKRCVQDQNYGMKRVIAFKPAIDTRFAKQYITSRTGLQFPAERIPGNITESLKNQIIEACENYDVVAFDESQFFSEAIISVARELSSAGKKVMLSGLNMDYLGKPFGHMGDLCCISDEIIQCKAYCSVCGADSAIYSQRIVKNDSTELIGDSEYYEPRCLHHFSSERKCK